MPPAPIYERALCRPEEQKARKPTMTTCVHGELSGPGSGQQSDPQMADVL